MTTIKTVNEIEETDGICSMVLYPEEERDVREEVFNLLAEEKLPIYEMKLQTLSLEDIFLKLTRTENYEEDVIEEEAVTEETVTVEEDKIEKEEE